MKILKHLFIPVLFIICCTSAFAQNNEDARALVKEGVKLNDEGKYADAIAKYNEVLKIDPDNLYADFEMAYTLFLSNKGDDGIPYIQKVIAANTSLAAGAYDLLGSIYDKDNEKDKAIETYMAGIKANPAYQRLYYNLGLVYFRYKEYAEAEKYAIEAIKLDPTHASSQRMYALVCFHQNKRVPALLGFCSFILLEPNTARSVESYNNIQHIIQGGILRDGNGKATILVSSKEDNDISALNLSISLVVLSGQQKKLSGQALFEDELKNIFTIAGQLSEKKAGKDLFWKYDADYFYKLAQSPNMAAFAHLVSGNTPESAQWIKDNPQPMTDFNNWVKATERSF
jgi:tetratricopeptide (TPR) repeat protein